MGPCDGSTGGLNRHQSGMKALKSVGVHPEVALPKSRSGIQGDGGVVALRNEMNDNVVRETPKRGDGDAMREVFAALFNVSHYGDECEAEYGGTGGGGTGQGGAW